MSDDSLKTPYEKSSGNYASTYSEAINYYKMLASKFPEVHFLTYGMTDVGLPLNLVVVSSAKDFEINDAREGGKKMVILVNNAIHAGEPEGVDATMALVRDLVTKKEMHHLLDHVVFAVIPVYNIGGYLNRNKTSRVNQDGPEEYGFRGNAQNLDLNRDFVKCDSKNAKSFTEIFQAWKPEVFIDNHVSDGADYQYVLTYFATHYSKLPPTLGNYVKNVYQPALEAQTKEMGFAMCPYVETLDETPDSGIVGFMETGRYATGYTSLFNTIGLCVETHMLKPFNKRLDATYVFMHAALINADKNWQDIMKAKKAGDEEIAKQNEFVLDWVLDKSKHDDFLFQGYEAGYKPSEVSGLPRLYYDRNKPFERNVPFYNYYEPLVKVTAPYYYILPQACDKAVERMKLNHIEMQRLTHDTVLEIEMYHIDKYETNPHAYEMHYNHTNTVVKASTMKVRFHAGDYVIPVHQAGARYIVEALEPASPDSYFAWNFYDAILQEKEYYSNYVFEDIAADLLKKDSTLRNSLEAKRKADPAFAASAKDQLDFVYRHSPYFEKEYMLYPVGRMMGKVDLGVE